MWILWKLQTKVKLAISAIFGPGGRARGEKMAWGRREGESEEHGSLCLALPSSSLSESQTDAFLSHMRLKMVFPT